MIVTDKNIICFPTVPWNHNWERQHEFIYFLASITTGKVIIHQPYGMINHNLKTIYNKFKTIGNSLAISKEEQKNPTLPNMEFVQTKFIPRHHNTSIDKLNARLIEKATPVKFEDSIVYATYINSFTFSLFKKGSIKILDLAARRQTLHELSSAFKSLEKEVVKSADVVFADNVMTIKDYQELNTNIFHLPQGVNPDRFNKPLKHELMHWREGYKTVVGYAGSDIVMDYKLLHTFISQNSTVLFLFVGALQREESKALLKYANVRFTGKINYNELGDYYALFDVGLIPYLLNDRTSGVFPTKLFEYLAAEKPVLSTALPDLLEYEEGFITIIDENNCTQKLANTLTSAVDKKSLENFVTENTRDKRFEFILSKSFQVTLHNNGSEKSSQEN